MATPEPTTTERVRWHLRRLRDTIPWVITHADDFVFALGRGLLASLTHPEKSIYADLRGIVTGDHKDTIRRPLTSGPYVVLSDHHLLYAGAPHDYYGGSALHTFRNERIGAQMMSWYAARGFTLVENGDVEDLVVTEPVESGAWLNCLIQGIGGHIAYRIDDGFRKIQRRRQLLRIRATYAARYRHLLEIFGAERIVKLIGNHDVELLQPGFREIVADALPGVVVSEFLVLIGDRVPIVVCHGHQMDPWTCQASARGVGESISESFAWAGQGADRIWLADEWGPPLSADNLAVGAPTCAPRKGFGVPKIRHMGERYLSRQMARMFPAAERPWLVLGHTHEPRLLVADRSANSGAAGRYQDLLWVVEIDGGEPKLYGWWCEDRDGKEILFRGELAPTGARVICARPQEIGPLGALPYGERPSADEVTRIVDGIEPLSRIPWMALAVRSLLHVATLLVGGWLVISVFRWALG